MTGFDDNLVEFLGFLVLLTQSLLQKLDIPFLVILGFLQAVPLGVEIIDLG